MFVRTCVSSADYYTDKGNEPATLVRGLPWSEAPVFFESFPPGATATFINEG